MKGGETFSNLKLRAGWGITGNQEFPSGASQARYAFTGPGAFSQVNYPNPDLKWQQDRQWNVGLDYGIFGGRVYGSIDYFDKLTSDLLYPTITPQPAPPGAPPTWRNLEGKVANSGLEFSANAMIIKNQSFQWDLGFNATWLKNEVSDMPGPLETGALHGQGITGATVQRIANGYPINVYYVRQYEGLDKDGQGIYTDEGFTKYYLGNPNPDFLLGVTTSLAWKKLALSMNMNGNFGQELYNNTANSVIPIGNLGSRNIASNLLGVNPKEALSNPITPSSRYIEDGSFFRLSNATLSYQIGPIGKAFRNSTVFVTGQNLLLFTDYTGYDPEVNTDKNVNGVPSVGIDYTSYPFSRTFLIGFTVSL
jgi:iron complex outermembrane receptor protein